MIVVVQCVFKNTRILEVIFIQFKI